MLSDPGYVPLPRTKIDFSSDLEKTDSQKKKKKVPNISISKCFLLSALLCISSLPLMSGRYVLTVRPIGHPDHTTAGNSGRVGVLDPGHTTAGNSGRVGVLDPLQVTQGGWRCVIPIVNWL